VNNKANPYLNKMTIKKSFTCFLKEYWLPVLLTGTCLMFSFYLQTKVYWSSMELPLETWLKNLNLHLTWHPFAIRYFQSYATLLVNKISPLSLRDSFYTVQFILAFITGPFFYNYLRQLKFSRLWSSLGLIFLLSAYPILGAHFEPTHTWDDFWLYLFLVLTFSALINHNWLKVGIFLTLSFYAREQILLFYPFIILFAWWSRKKDGILKPLLYIFVPLLIYIIFRIIIWEDIDPTRWKLFMFNFADVKRTTDTIVSTIISFGFMWVTTLIALGLMFKEKLHAHQRFLFWGGLITIFMNTLFTLSLTFARETRIFFPPFIFVIPLTLISLKAIAQRISYRYSWTTLIAGLISIPVLIYFGIRLSNVLFPFYEYVANADFRRILLGSFGMGYYLKKESRGNAMKNISFKFFLKSINWKAYRILAAPIILFILGGCYLFFGALETKIFTEELLIWDCIRLDFWALLFCFVIIFIWRSGLSWQSRSVLLLSSLAIYALVTVGLIFDGTPFSINAYWGDQKFRTAMIAKYLSFGNFTDVFYRGLPPFYPPLYYFLLSLYARVFSIEAFKMIKIGNLLIYLFGPFILYFLWKRLVSPLQAFLITFFTFLFCSLGKITPLVSPHAFIGNTVFIPWWLYYIERVKNS